MKRTTTTSPRAAVAIDLVTSLQKKLAGTLEDAGARHGMKEAFGPIEWDRDEGRHGGGTRLCTAESEMFHSASVNVSHVHYDDDADKKLRSATALSTIIHPRHPRVPSMHMHISWTEMRDGRGMWRVMADLNPSIVDEAARDKFSASLEQAAPALYDEARAQGDRYFFIPALDRHRGVSHFYLESYATDDAEADLALARTVGESTIETYAGIVDAALANAAAPTDEEQAKQLEYHTVYFFQVLTLDRGTTSGLLVHNQNDVGILGSIPPHIDRDRAASWVDKVPPLQRDLVANLAAALPDPTDAKRGSKVTDAVRQTLADVVRRHYQAHPEALDLQAAGNVIPPTVDNHR